MKANLAHLKIIPSHERWAPQLPQDFLEEIKVYAHTPARPHIPQNFPVHLPGLSRPHLHLQWILFELLISYAIPCRYGRRLLLHTV